MADSLALTVTGGLKGTYQNTLTNQTNPVSLAISVPLSLVFTDGTTTLKADKFWSSEGRTLDGATSENIDLYDLASLDIGVGAGLDPLGGAFALADVVALIVKNASTSTGNLTLGGEGSAAAWNSLFGTSDTATLGPIPPNGFVVVGTGNDPGWAVADTSNHLLKVASSADLTYDIYVVGRSA